MGVLLPLICCLPFPFIFNARAFFP
uniref:Uncharacterized protein n=1 Tax=Rhizophora mucronata TaxID=61149 RepID=A0A2P2NDQ2_RHIMU